MYLEHFGLSQHPFQAVAQGNRVYVGRRQTRALANLKIALAMPDAIATLTGPVGIGKTTLATRALDLIAPQRAVARVGRTPMTGDELLEHLLGEFGIGTSGTGRIERLRKLREFFKDSGATQVRALVLVEDAQALDVDILRELESVTAADPGGSPGANIILMGPASIDGLIDLPELEHLRQRTRLRQQLEPLSVEEIEGYVRHQLETAGGDFTAMVDPHTPQALHACTGGIPRIVNNLCETALTVAATSKLKKLLPQLVKRVAVTIYGIQLRGGIEPGAAETGPNAEPPIRPFTDTVINVAANAAPQVEGSRLPESQFPVDDVAAAVEAEAESEPETAVENAANEQCSESARIRTLSVLDEPNTPQPEHGTVPNTQGTGLAGQDPLSSQGPIQPPQAQQVAKDATGHGPAPGSTGIDWSTWPVASAENAEQGPAAPALPKEPPASVLTTPSPASPKEPPASVLTTPSPASPKEPPASVLTTPSPALPKEPPASVLNTPSPALPKEPPASVLNTPSPALPKEPPAPAPTAPAPTVQEEAPAMVLATPAPVPPQRAAPTLEPVLPAANAERALPAATTAPEPAAPQAPGVEAVPPTLTDIVTDPVQKPVAAHNPLTPAATPTASPAVAPGRAARSKFPSLARTAPASSGEAGTLPENGPMVVDPATIDPELQQLAAQVASVTSLEDLDELLAETLFGNAKLAQLSSNEDAQKLELSKAERRAILTAMDELGDNEPEDKKNGDGTGSRNAVG